jgi:hypothetical protein
MFHLDFGFSELNGGFHQFKFHWQGHPRLVDAAAQVPVHTAAGSVGISNFAQQSTSSSAADASWWTGFMHMTCFVKIAG